MCMLARAIRSNPTACATVACRCTRGNDMCCAVMRHHTAPLCTWQCVCHVCLCATRFCPPALSAMGNFIDVSHLSPCFCRHTASHCTLQCAYVAHVGATVCVAVLGDSLLHSADLMHARNVQVYGMTPKSSSSQHHTALGLHWGAGPAVLTLWLDGLYLAVHDRVLCTAWHACGSPDWV